MKNTLLALLLVCFAFVAQAQTNFPLKDLESFCAKNANDFETAMLSADYSIQSKVSNQVTKIYWSDKDGANGKKYIITRTQAPHATISIEFNTTDKKYYLDFKAGLTKNGYKFVKEENKKVNGVETVWYNFSNGKYQIAVASWTADVAWFGVQIHP